MGRQCVQQWQIKRQGSQKTNHPSTKQRSAMNVKNHNKINEQGTKKPPVKAAQAAFHTRFREVLRTLASVVEPVNPLRGCPKMSRPTADTPFIRRATPTPCGKPHRACPSGQHGKRCGQALSAVMCEV